MTFFVFKLFNKFYVFWLFFSRNYRWCLFTKLHVFLLDHEQTQSVWALVFSSIWWIFKKSKKSKVCGLWCFHQFDEFLQNFHFFEKKCQKKSFCFTILILTSRKQWFWWIRHNPKIHQSGSFMKADGIPAKVLPGRI